MAGKDAPEILNRRTSLVRPGLVMCVTRAPKVRLKI